MAYRSRRRSSYRRGSVGSGRETFQAKQWGAFGLTSANQQIAPLDLLGHYQNQQTYGDPSGSTIATDVGRCTVLGVRGWIAFYYTSQTQFPSVDDQQDTRLGFGIRCMSTASAANANELSERQRLDPYNTANRSAWDSWIWRRSRPAWPRPEVGDAGTLGYDPVQSMWVTRFGVKTSNMRKMSLGESVYLLGGVNFDPGSGGDISVAYELNVALAKP